ncbi:MAG: AAA family ATPase [Helicobacteraceae bacterium]|nr:AAA family ATPase [Helicobacteraceae bacterium]
MKIQLKNMGMLDEAEFEVGDITLICGENNTGKTYATYSLYGYLDFLSSELKGIFFYTITDHLNEIEMEDCCIKIPNNILQEFCKNITDRVKNTYKEKLSEVLAGSDHDFEHSLIEDTKLRSSMKQINTNDKINTEYLTNTLQNNKFFELVEITESYIKLDYNKGKKHIEDKGMNSEFKKLHFMIVFLMSLYPKYPKAFILSAERTGASMFQKELDVNKNEIVDEISKAKSGDIEQAVLGILTKRYSRYPKPVKDNIYFIRELEDIAKEISFIQKGVKENSNAKGLYQKILDLLFDIVGGKYIVSQGSVEFAPGAKKRITKGKFSIQRASSSVRSLLMLNYYILHKAQQGDILMIDEPELNLHPKNQIRLARLFALLANAGIKIFITTHSDYIVRELSNCIMLSNLTDQAIQKLKNRGYLKEYKLNSDKIKAYVAKNIKGKNTLENVKITKEQGIFMETFDEAIESQNGNQGLIFEEIYRKQDGK